MSEGRSFVFPQAIGFGARPLAVPKRGAVMCASAFFPFRLSDGAPVTPANWYQTISAHAGPDVIPDSVAPLPGAEVLVLGALAPVGERREASLRCGSVERRFVLNPDPDDPDAPLLPGPGAAAWHDEDNPDGRGGPDDDREPLILAMQDRNTPVWLGPTPFDHPLRLRRAGTPDAASGAGWPTDASPTVLYEAHPAFWAKALYPGEPLAYEGLAGPDLATNLPPYRVTITSARDDGRWVPETARIHCVTLVPEADVGAVIWRAAIDLGDDILGDSVVALVAALEDADAPVKDEDHWGIIAVDRWDDPLLSMDDRPLLPAALAASVTLPFALPEDDVMEARRSAAESWIRDEAGLPDENPFGDAAPEEAKLADKMQSAADDGDNPPDPTAVGDLAQTALAAGKRRHEEAGFKVDEEDLDPERPRDPVVRGNRLDAEIARRLSAPYGAPNEMAMAEHLRTVETQDFDLEGALIKIADARLTSPEPQLTWPALDETEAGRFGDRVSGLLSEKDPVRHLDVSGATVGGGGSGAAGGEPGTGNGAFGANGEGEDRLGISGRRLDGLLAEETIWRGVDFSGCEITDSSFAGGRFENCTFENCMFEKTNLSRATLAGSDFVDCTFQDLRITEPVWTDCRFDRCVFQRLSLTDAAVRDLSFTDGEWEEVEWVESLMVDVALRGTRMRQITYMQTHAPNSRFERLSMFKVWGMGKGFPGSVFEEVEAKTCGFISTFYFMESRFERTRFVETGFSGAVFKNALLAPGCQFTTCDLGGALFENTRLAGVRFVQCNLVTSRWLGADASEAWFFGALLRNVDFDDTELGRAVFMDADLEGTKFQPDKTIGADFRGTVRGIE